MALGALPKWERKPEHPQDTAGVRCNEGLGTCWAPRALLCPWVWAELWGEDAPTRSQHQGASVLGISEHSPLCAGIWLPYPCESSPEGGSFCPTLSHIQSIFTQWKNERGEKTPVPKMKSKTQYWKQNKGIRGNFSAGEPWSERSLPSRGNEKPKPLVLL